MPLQDLKNKLVAVLGYGVEGKAVAAYLLKHGIKPVLFDQKPWEQWATEDQDAIKALGINFVFGPDAFLELKGFNVAFRSPGIRISQFTIYNLQLTSQAKWFFDNCPAKIIGVTGTKGKGTTSALTYEMLKASGKNVFLTGNIGKTQPLEILDALKPEDLVVYELSSFQLQDLTKSPHIGVVLMVTSEHLDYHKDQTEYLEAKTAITKFQTVDDFAVINADLDNSVKIGSQGSGKKLYFSRQKNNVDCFVQDGNIISSTSSFQLPASSLQLRGAHNLENVMAAILAAKSLGCEDATIKSAAQNFKGLEHRLEFVNEKNGIKFYDDSFSTTPETAIAAISSFTEPLILILGGQTKNSDFSSLGKVVADVKNIKSVILIGDERFKIQASIKGHNPAVNIILSEAKNMTEIFKEIRGHAKEGDVVLLSPACTSFDMFKNYKDRGEQFKIQVQKW